MNHNIIPNLVSMAVPIEDVMPLRVNPHKGNVEAAKAVLLEFGQHTPILVHSETRQILAGNTRYRAATELGWTHVAVVYVDEDTARSQARALADNRLAELGTDDQAILANLLPEIIEDYSQVFDVLGWDEWAVAAIEEGVMFEPVESGYTPPPTVRRDPVVANIETQNSGEQRLVAPSGSNQQDLVQRGAGETDSKRATIIQYTLVFTSAEEQRRWYEFLTWMRSDPELTQYATTSEKLMNFLEARIDF